jgi:hypothetical protein
MELTLADPSSTLSRPQGDSGSTLSRPQGDSGSTPSRPQEDSIHRSHLAVIKFFEEWL